MTIANPDKISLRAKKRGQPQLGSLGSGNHFLEIQAVDEIYDSRVAKRFGITEKGQVTVMIPTGSRGFGHQIPIGLAKPLKMLSTGRQIVLECTSFTMSPTTLQKSRNMKWTTVSEERSTSTEKALHEPFLPITQTYLQIIEGSVNR